MLKVFIFVIVVALIAITIITLIVVRAAYVFIKKLKDMHKESLDNDDFERLSKRRRQQYSYGGRTGQNSSSSQYSNTSSSQYSNTSSSQYTNTTSSSGYSNTSSHSNTSSESPEQEIGKEVLIDMRDPSKRNRKIFESDEGEYVDFESE